MEKPKMVQKIQKKVLVVGLENCGKTSIILNMLGKKSLLHYLPLDPTKEARLREKNHFGYEPLNPTKGLDIKSLQDNGSVFSIWDLGGQKAFRDEYLENFERFFTGPDKIIYVIDVQDEEKYDTSLEYFSTILKELIKHEIKSKITVFIHKYDPDLKEIRSDITPEIVNNLIEKIKNLIPSTYFFEIYKTTIFTVLNKEHVY